MYALLPMKAHSERVPDKNVRPLHGQPLFFYIGDTLQRTGLFERLVIDTDGPLIEALAKERYKEWVEIIQRPHELRGDFVPMNDVIAHDIRVLGLEHDFLQTHSTNPFLTRETLLKATETYIEGKRDGRYDSLFAVNAIRTRLYDKDVKPLNHNPSVLGRTQDLDVIYEENSNFYLFSGASFMRNNHRIGQTPQVFSMTRNSIESLDVDDLSDWEFAESVLRGRQG